MGMPTLECPNCGAQWHIPGSMIDFNTIDRYKHVVCPKCNRLVHFVKIIKRIP